MNWNSSNRQRLSVDDINAAAIEPGDKLATTRGTTEEIVFRFLNAKVLQG